MKTFPFLEACTVEFSKHTRKSLWQSQMRMSIFLYYSVGFKVLQVNTSHFLIVNNHK